MINIHLIGLSSLCVQFSCIIILCGTKTQSELIRICTDITLRLGAYISVWIEKLRLYEFTEIVHGLIEGILINGNRGIQRRITRVGQFP